MYAIAFDLRVSDTERHHPNGVTAAYADIGNILKKFDFEWKQGSLYVTENEDMSNLFDAIQALRSMTWFPLSVRDIRAFRIEQWSDFTKSVKAKA